MAGGGGERIGAGTRDGSGGGSGAATGRRSGVARAQMRRRQRLVGHLSREVGENRGSGLMGRYGLAGMGRSERNNDVL
jgi:hypothetical protein